MKELPYFARRLRELRDAAKLTQHELAARAGVHPVNVAQLERGTRGPSWNTVLLLARALGVSCSAFESDQAEPPAEEPARPRGRPKKAAQGETAAAKKRKRKRKTREEQ